MGILKKNNFSDKNKLISLMNSAISGNIILCNEKDFDDKTLANTYNDFISKILQFDNRTAVELNKSMKTIGNCNNVRTMLEIVSHQKNSLKAASDTGKNISESINKCESILNIINNDVESAYNTSLLSKKAIYKMLSNVNESHNAIINTSNAMEGFSHKSETIKDILNIVNNIASQTQILSLNAKIEASRSVDGEGFSVVADEISTLSADTQKSVNKMQQFVHEILNDIGSLVKQLNNLKDLLEFESTSAKETENSIQKMTYNMQNIMEEISNLYTHINIQNNSTKIFTENMLAIAKDSDTLASYCREPAKDMHIISRSIDKIRTKYIKSHSNLSQKDLLEVYDIDHLIFTGRLYNMIEGFEILKIKNLNQPKNCKYGKWIEKLRIEQPSIFKSFELANTYHNNLHKLATSCFYANEDGEKERALNFFEEAQNVYKKFSAELNRLKTFFS